MVLAENPNGQELNASKKKRITAMKIQLNQVALNERMIQTQLKVIKWK